MTRYTVRCKAGIEDWYLDFSKYNIDIEKLEKEIYAKKPKCAPHKIEKEPDA